MEQFDLIVIGAGISGVALATRAAADGLRVAVIEQHATVAQGASFAHSGLMYPSPLDPWFGPGPQAAMEGGLPWQKKARQMQADRKRIEAFSALSLLADRSRDALARATKAHNLECEVREGALYLFRSAQTLARAQALGPALTEAAIGHRFMDADACRALEPALTHADELAGAVLLNQVWSGNCALAAKRLKAALPAAFLLARRVVAMHVGADYVEVDVQPAMQAAGAFSGVQAKGFTMPSAEPVLKVTQDSQDATQRLRAQHVVVAAGSASAAVLATANIAVPILPVMPIVSRALTGVIRHDHYAPRRMLVDAERGVGIVRFENRLRTSIAVAGKKIGKSGRTLSAKRLDNLDALMHACAEHRVPGAANLNREAGHADHAIGIDAEPIIGEIGMTARSGLPRATRLPSASHTGNAVGPLHICLPATYRGWALAFGAADIILDKIQGLPIDPAFERFSPRRFAG